MTRDEILAELGNAGLPIDVDVQVIDDPNLDGRYIQASDVLVVRPTSGRFTVLHEGAHAEHWGEARAARTQGELATRILDWCAARQRSLRGAAVGDHCRLSCTRVGSTEDHSSFSRYIRKDGEALRFSREIRRQRRDASAVARRHEVSRAYLAAPWERIGSRSASIFQDVDA